MREKKYNSVLLSHSSITDGNYALKKHSLNAISIAGKEIESLSRASVGAAVGRAVGVAVGATVGAAVGTGVGRAVGRAVGAGVGAAVGAPGVAVGLRFF